MLQECTCSQISVCLAAKGRCDIKRRWHANLIYLPVASMYCHSQQTLLLKCWSEWHMS